MRIIVSIASIAVASVASTIMGGAAAGGFYTPEQGAGGTGVAFAGAAAVAEDATTIYFNPAGMTNLNATEIINTLHVVVPNTRFSNGNSIAAAGQPLGGDSGSVGKATPLGNLYVMIPLNQFRFGLGFGSPFGLKTEYPRDWMGRFQGVNSESMAPTLNLAIAYKFNDKFSLGAGASAQRFSAELTNAVNYTAVVAQGASQLGIALPAMPGLEGYAVVKGHDYAYGYNFGALFQPTEQLRIGASYRSPIKHRLEGDVSFDRPSAPGSLPAAAQGAANQIIAGATPNGPVSVDVKLPGLAMLSAVYDIDVEKKLQLLGDVTWMGWSTLKEIRIYRDNGTLLTRQDYSWRDTYRFSVGARYQLSEKIALRTGVAYDQTPARDATRGVRLPDSDKQWLAFGIQYKHSGKIILDFGYAHLFARTASIHDDQRATGGGVIDGTYKTHADLFSAQLTYRM